MSAGHGFRERIAHAATPWEWWAPSVVVMSILVAATVVWIFATSRTWGQLVGAAVWTAIVGWPWTRSVLRWRRLHGSRRPQPHA